MQTQALVKWTEYTGATPEGLGDIPDYDPARHTETMGESDTHWLLKRRLGDGGMKLYISPKAGLAGNQQVGATNNLAEIVDGSYAEGAASNWQSADPHASGFSAGDVFDLVTPGSDISGITDTVYVQFGDPPNAQVWKYEPANGQGYFSSTVNQSKLIPRAQLVNGVPPGATPKPNPNAPGTPGAPMSTTMKVLIGGGVVAAALLGAWAITHFSKKHGGKHHTSKHHGGHHAHAPRRRRRRK